MSEEAARRTITMSDLSGSERYFLLISAIVPRPIAWVSSVSASGVRNLAPFSFFQGVSSTPPILMLAIANSKSNGEAKDTLANILASREFVVGTVSEDSGETAVKTAAEVPADVDEFALADVASFPAVRVSPPCIAEAGVNLECRLHQTLEVGNSTAVFGEVLLAHVREDLLDARNVVDPERLRPLGRLGGSLYLPYSESIRIKR